MTRIAASRTLALVAVVLLVLAAFGVHGYSIGELDLIALGLAAFAAAFVVT